ncbi:hypothetical protein KR074_000334 [Drosophila pseudoananassae]|nr:hypothetical protein KR074_000334 [Drosophila pseudoananassae]
MSYLPEAFSNINLTPECRLVFEQIHKLKQHRYAIFSIKDNDHIQVESLGVREAGYEDFLADLKRLEMNLECRYCLYDYAYHQGQGTSSTCVKEKLFLMLWTPEDALVKKKLMYSTEFKILKREFDGVQTSFEAKNLDEACRDKVEERLDSD